MKIFAISDMHGNLEGLDPSDSDVVDVFAGGNHEQVLEFTRFRGNRPLGV